MDYFRVEVEQRNGRAAVRAIGELDLVSADQLSDAIDIAASASEVVIDLAGVTYFGACGVRLLKRARDDAFARGSTLTVGGASRIVRTVLEIVDELDLLDDETQPAT